MKNIEIKAYYKNLEFGREKARSIFARYVGLDHQIDTYFKTTKGRFKLRESSLSGALLVPYFRNDTKNAKVSMYTLINLEKPEEVKEIFSNMFGVDIVVEKRRDFYLKDNVRIHLDDVKNLGTFFELEAVCNEQSNEDEEREKVQDLLKLFEVKREDLIEGSYLELLKKVSKK